MARAGLSSSEPGADLSAWLAKIMAWLNGSTARAEPFGSLSGLVNPSKNLALLEFRNKEGTISLLWKTFPSQLLSQFGKLPVLYNRSEASTFVTYTDVILQLLFRVEWTLCKQCWSKVQAKEVTFKSRSELVGVWTNFPTTFVALSTTTKCLRFDHGPPSYEKLLVFLVQL